MSVLSSRPALRWALPAGVVAVAIASVGGGTVLAANAKPTLPNRTAAQLLVDLQTAKVDGLSGTVVAKADLGLPALPQMGGGSADLTSLVTGAHTLRVWYAGDTKARVALLDTLGESDVIRNGKDVWTWASQGNKASHYTIPANLDREDAKKRLPANVPKTPQDAADQALKLIDPTTTVTTDGAASVAGRDAYELKLAPKDASSKVQSIQLAVDSETKIPLRVRVFAKGTQDPAIEIGFTQLSVAKPGDSNFRFNPPPGVKVTEEKAPGMTAGAPDKATTPDKTTPDKAAPGKAAPGKGTPDKTGKGMGLPGGAKVVGTGWTSVAVIPTGGKGLPQSAGQLTGVLNSLPRVSGSWGSGRLLSSKLFSVLLTDDGRIVAGAVTPEKLYAAAK
ncbi:MAG: hypothetical protein QOD41_2689 [Cryptosporangiaceae bacterium]|nr:hypothetical protein [Cryptosporangiaceae bacterium]